MKFDIVSLFSGAGGLDTGFHNAGFNVVWANEFDKKITPTLRHNFPTTSDAVNVGSCWTTWAGLRGGAADGTAYHVSVDN